MNRSTKRRALSISAMLALAVSVKAGTFQADFNSGTTAPPGTAVQGANGGGVIEETGGVNNSGALKITKAVNGQTGSFIIDDLDAGAPVYGFDFSAKVRIGGGSATPADGFSINFDPNIFDGEIPGEEGTAGGVAITFDIYDNGAETPAAPSIDVKVNGAVVGTRQMPFSQILTGADYVDFNVHLSPAGMISMDYKGSILFTNLALTTYQPIAGGRWAIGGRTGGLNVNQFFDDISITTHLEPEVGITVQPVSQTVVLGSDLVLNPQFSNAESATFQWYRNGVAISGATSSTLTVPNIGVADNDSKYKVEVTGPNNSVTSDEVTVTVADLELPSTFNLSFNFDDGQIPPGTLVTGGAYLDIAGGVDGSGVLHITDAFEGQIGGFIVGDADAGAAVHGFTAVFDMRLGGGSATPADGISFNFASDIPDDLLGELENGVGTGLTVGFDIYDNGGGEAPSVDVRYGGRLVDSVKVPMSFLDTGDGFANVIVNLEADGTLDVAYRGTVLFQDLQIPGFSSISGGRFVFGGRTGGAYENQWIDNLELSTDLVPGPLRITEQPDSQTLLAGQTATFSADVNDPTGVTYQWLKDGVEIPAATASSYTTLALVAGDDGADYSVRATKGGVSVTSEAAALKVISITPTIAFNFDSDTTPAGTVLAANDVTLGGYISGGVLHLTDAVNSASGAFVIQPLLGGAELGAFTVAFDVLIGGGTALPADGFSFNVAPNLAETVLGDAEEGTGGGLTITFDTYDNGAAEAPSVDVKYKGAVIAQTKMSVAEIQSGEEFRQVVLRVTAEGKLDLVLGDRVLQIDLQLPDYTPVSNPKFGFYGRTGGANANQWLDNIRIEAIKTIAPLRVSIEPQDVALLAGKTATFGVTLSDPLGATYQWFRNGQPIVGATSPTYTTPAVTTADNEATFSVTAAGTGGTVTSRTAVLVVVPPITVTTPDVSFNFDDGGIPAGTELNSAVGGGGYVTFDGGVNNSGVLRLTEAFNDQGGTFIISDFSNGEPVGSFTAHFKALVGGGSAVPADGFSFVWASDLTPGVVFGEDGSGSGLVVSFDIYDNLNGEAPAFNIFWGGNEVAVNKVAISEMRTGDQFVDVGIRLESDGTIDLQYNGNVIFNNVQIPGFAPITNGSFAFGGRTGGLNENQWIDDIEIVTGGAPVTGPALNVARDGANLTFTWTGSAVLQATSDLGAGNWQVVAGAASGYSEPANQPHRFYRLVVE